MVFWSSGCSSWTTAPESVSATPMPDSDAPNYEIVAIAETGLSFDVPANWQRLEPIWAWSPEIAGQARVAVQWEDIQRPVEMEAAMLPQNAVTLEAESIELSWGQGRRYTVEVYARAVPSRGKESAPQVVAVESQVLIAVVTDSSRRVFDLYASARDAEERSTLQPVLQRMWTSAQPAP